MKIHIKRNYSYEALVTRTGDFFILSYSSFHALSQSFKFVEKETNVIFFHCFEPQTSYLRDIRSGPDIETQGKAETMSRREGADHSFYREAQAMWARYYHPFSDRSPQQDGNDSVLVSGSKD